MTPASSPSPCPHRPPAVHAFDILVRDGVLTRLGRAAACTCANGLEKEYPPRIEAEPVGSSAQCWSDPGFNYDSHPDNVKEVSNVATVGDCCDLCDTTPNCSFFTYTAEHQCFLKRSAAGRQPLKGGISGGTGVRPPRPPTLQGCDQGVRVGGGGQPCLWWSQGWWVRRAQLAACL